MAEVTRDEEISTGQPGMEIVEVTASTTETLRSRRFHAVTGCIIGYNFASGGFTDEKCEASISGQVVTLEMIGTDSTDAPMSALIVGRE